MCLLPSFSHSNLVNLLTNLEMLLILEAFLIQLIMWCCSLEFAVMADCQDRIQLHKYT